VLLVKNSPGPTEEGARPASPQNRRAPQQLCPPPPRHVV